MSSKINVLCEARFILRKQFMKCSLHLCKHWFPDPTAVDLVRLLPVSPDIVI